MRVARAFNTDIDFPVIITRVQPFAQPSIVPALSQQIYRALANYLVSRVSAELPIDDTTAEKTDPGMGRVVSDRSGAQVNDGTLVVRGPNHLYLVTLLINQTLVCTPHRHSTAVSVRN